MFFGRRQRVLIGEPTELTAEGKGLTEINELLGPETAKIFADAGFSKTEVVNDFYDKNRFVFYSK